MYEDRRMKYLSLFGNFFGSFLSIIDRFFPFITIRVIFHNRLVFIRLGTTDVDVLYSVFIKKEYDFTEIKDAEVIIDAGAYCGYSSLFFLEKYPNALIIAIEPLESNYSLLVNNCKKFGNISPINKALWGSITTVNMYDRKTGYWGYAVSKDEKHDACNTLSIVNTITIDEIIKMFNLSSIDLLKIDIEGSEKEVFENSDSWIDKVEIIAIELHDRIKQGCSDSFYFATRSFCYESKQNMTVIKSKKNLTLD